MLKLYTASIDPEALRTKLEQFISAPPETLPLAERLRPAEPGIGESLLRGHPLLRKTAHAAQGWRASGYSPRWLVKRLPIVGGIAAALWALTHTRAFRHQMHYEIENLKNQMQQAQAQNRQRMAQLEEDNRLLAARIKTLETDMRLLEHSGQEPGNPGHAARHR